MSEWDDAPIYSSNLGARYGDSDDEDGDDRDHGGGVEEGEELDDHEDAAHNASQTRYHRKNRFREFIRNFRLGGQDFVYRDQLLRNHRRNEHRLECDLAHLGQFDEQLLHWLKTQPNEMMPLFEVAAREALGLSISVGDSQLAEVPTVQVVLRTEETAREMRSLSSAELNKLVVVPGIIISASRAKPKATSIAVTCVSCNSAKQIKLDTAFGQGEAPTRCWNEDCPARKNKQGTDNLVFLPDRATFVDQQSLKLQEAPEMVPTGEMPRSMLCSVSNWLVDLVSPGMRVSILGVSSVFQSRGMEKSQHHVKTPYIKVLGIATTEESSGRSYMKFTDAEEEQMLSIARSPASVYERLWQSIAPSISGAYTIDIKKAIACLLMGGSRKRLPDGAKLRGDINVLLLGDPSTAKSQFLKFVERVAPVGVYTSGKGSSAAGLTASVVKDSRGEFYLEGGAMILADGGVVCIDEFDKMREQDRVAIHECMEQQTISIAKAGITTILNSRTSVLAAANPVFGTYNDAKSASENIDFLPTILSRFDMIFIVRDVRDADKDRGIAKHVLGIHVGFAGGRHRRSSTKTNKTNEGAHDAHDEGEFDLRTMKKYIAYCRSRCAPSLNAAAAEMLRNHYVGIREEHRRVKADTQASTVPITVRQLEAIVRISESLAKMTLSAEATPEHVAEALRLFKVSTLNAAQNDRGGGGGGAGAAMGGQLTGEQLREVQRIEEQMQRMVPIGSVVPTKRLQDDFVLKQGYGAGSVHRALQILVARSEFAYLNQQKHVKRIR